MTKNGSFHTVLDRARAYYTLTKPGIIYGNLLTAVGGYLYGAILRPEPLQLLGLMIGTAGVIGSGCVINNYLDRTIDKHMKRTKNRALVNGTIRNRDAIIFAALLAIIGVGILLLFVNVLTAALGLVGLISYAYIYTYAKRVTVHGTLIGTLPGAIPPVAGYTAATGVLDVSALLLFLILATWQMVHFYAISIYRLAEYKQAHIPLMPIVHGIPATKLQMLIYCCLFLLAVISLAHFSYAGLIYVVIMGTVGLWWLLIVFSGLYTDDNEAWARKVFGMSLLILLAFSFCLAINAWTP